MLHYRRQKRLRRLLEPKFEGFGIVDTEVSFRAEAEYELRVAAVAVVERKSWEAVDDDGYLMGAPDLVIEVLSPSNTAQEVEDKRDLV